MKRKRVLLELETLEARDVPSTLLPPPPTPMPAPGPVPGPVAAAGSQLAWMPPVFGSDYKWGTAGNWVNTATVARPALPPGAFDDVLFSHFYSDAKCYLGPTVQACNSITIKTGYDGVLDLSGGTLNANTTLASRSTVGVSVSLLGGEICADTGPGTLNVKGGTFFYDADCLNSNLVNPAAMTIRAGGGAVVTIATDCINIGANLQAGLPGVGPGTVEIATTAATNNCAFYNGAVIAVQPQSRLIFDNEAAVYRAAIASAGTVTFGNDVYVGMVTGGSFIVTGGMVLAGNDDVVDGNMLFNAGMIDLGPGNGTYYTFTVKGVLWMQNAEVDFDVDGGSNTSDQLVAGGVSLAGGDVSRCYTWGVPTTGTHTYNPITDNNLGWQGAFASYQWDGDLIDMAWTPEYSTLVWPYGYLLTGTVV